MLVKDLDLDWVHQLFALISKILKDLLLFTTQVDDLNVSVLKDLLLKWPTVKPTVSIIIQHPASSNVTLRTVKVRQTPALCNEKTFKRQIKNHQEPKESQKQSWCQSVSGWPSVFQSDLRQSLIQAKLVCPNLMWLVLVSPLWSSLTVPQSVRGAVLPHSKQTKQLNVDEADAVFDVTHLDG